MREDLKQQLAEAEELQRHLDDLDDETQGWDDVSSEAKAAFVGGEDGTE